MRHRNTAVLVRGNPPGDDDEFGTLSPWQVDVTQMDVTEQGADDEEVRVTQVPQPGLGIRRTQPDQESHDGGGDDWKKLTTAKKSI